MSLLLSDLVNAGGISWLFAVQSLENLSDTSAIIELNSNSGENYLPNECKLVKIFIHYQPESMMKKTWTGRFVTRRKHVKALEYLNQSYENNQNIRFGVMGGGMIAYAPNQVKDSPNFLEKLLSIIGKGAETKVTYTPEPCFFETRGIAILKEDENKSAVYAFYGSI